MGLDEGEEDVDGVGEFLDVAGVGDAVPGVDPGEVGEWELEPFCVVVVGSALFKVCLIFWLLFSGAIDAFEKPRGYLVVCHSWRRRNSLHGRHLHMCQLRVGHRGKFERNVRDHSRQSKAPASGSKMVGLLNNPQIAVDINVLNLAHQVAQRLVA